MPGLEEGLGFLLAQVARAHQNLVRRSLQETELHRGQPTLLIILHNQDGITNSQLAVRMEVTPPTVTNMVKRMERVGLLARRRDAADDRLSRVYLTDAGRAAYSDLDPIARRIDKATFAGFTEEEETLLRDLLSRLHENLRQALTQDELP